MGDLGQLGYRTTRGRETVAFWRSQLLASIDQWEAGTDRREPIRAMVSELSFPFLMVKDGGGAVPSSHGMDNAVRRRHPQMDQIDLNLPLRYVQKLSSNIGDEIPEVQWSREWTSPWEEHAYKFDNLTEMLMSQAGAPENNAEGAKDVCCDGITTYWIMPTYGLTADDLFRATEAVDQVIERVLTDPDGYTPAEGADHDLMGQVLEARADDFSAMVKDPTGMISAALRLASTKHYAAAAKDQKDPWRWRSDKIYLEHERLPYGTHAVMESGATDFRHTRFVARKIRMPVLDARRHPAFHPSIRKEIQRVELASKGLRKHLDSGWTSMTDEDQDEYLGYAEFWEIHDRKNLELIYLDLNMERFLNAGSKNGVSRMRHPLLNERGKPLIPPMGQHPGFFPCDFLAPLKPQRDDEFKKLAIPLLEPGMKLVFAITKLVSHYVQTVKRASSAIYEAHPKLNDAARRAIKAGVDGTIFTRPPDVPPGESVVAVQWKAPSEELFRQVKELIGDWCMVQSFPLAELTTQAQADTLGQEEIGISAGDAWMQEVVRKFEISYAIQCGIMSHLSMYFTTKADWAELIGMDDANTLHALVSQIRFPPRLPGVRYASRRRDANPIRIGQLFTLDERVAAAVDPVFQLPIFERERLLQEAARALDIGKLARYSPDIEQMKLLADAKARIAREQQMAQTQMSPAAPARSKPVENRPAVGGSPGGSASQSRGSPAARRSRRGGRRGRSKVASTSGNEMSAAKDVVQGE